MGKILTVNIGLKWLGAKAHTRFNLNIQLQLIHQNHKYGLISRYVCNQWTAGNSSKVRAALFLLILPIKVLIQFVKVYDAINGHSFLKKLFLS